MATTKRPANVTARRYVTRDGSNLDHAQAQAIMARAGFAPDALDYMRIGDVYCNGTLWLQRMYDA